MKVSRRHTCRENAGKREESGKLGNSLANPFAHVETIWAIICESLNPIIGYGKISNDDVHFE